MSKRVLFVVALLLAVSGRAQAEALGIGSPAPKIQVKEWVKGDAVPAFEKGKLYVVEFWATWCGPCLESIPHLTELQKKFKDVTFIGVSIWEEDQARVKPFVTRMGDRMAYRVAMDLVPEGADGHEGRMGQAWMTAAQQEGLPTAFVVNGEGKIVCIDHPMELEQELPQIAAGKWDLEKAASDLRQRMARQAKLGALMKQLRTLDPKLALVTLNDAIKSEPELEMMFGPFKLRLMRAPGADPMGALAYGKRLVETVYKDDPQGLNAVAWELANPKVGKPQPEYVAIALSAAKRADELTKGKSAQVADTLARAYFVSGDAAKALETQQRALKLAEGTELADDPEFKQRLMEYEKAAQK